MSSKYGYMLDASGNAIPIADPGAASRAELEAYRSLTIPPVGNVQIFWNDIEPAAIWGGTWELTASGRVPVGAGTADSGTVYTAGQTGGEETHALTVTEMPSHTHRPRSVSWGGQGLNSTVDKNGSFWVFDENEGAAVSDNYSDKKGGSQPHNIMQPYEVFNIWKRVA